MKDDELDQDESLILEPESQGEDDGELWERLVALNESEVRA